MNGRSPFEHETLVDLFRQRAEESKIKRAMNRESSARILAEHGIEFVSKNNGAHLLLLNGRISLWPGTGLWRDSVLPREGRGVRNLIKYLKEL